MVGLANDPWVVRQMTIQRAYERATGLDKAEHSRVAKGVGLHAFEAEHLGFLDDDLANAIRRLFAAIQPECVELLLRFARGGDSAANPAKACPSPEALAGSSFDFLTLPGTDLAAKAPASIAGAVIKADAYGLGAERVGAALAAAVSIFRIFAWACGERTRTTWA